MKEFFKKNRYYLYLIYIPIYLVMFFITEHFIDGSNGYWVSWVPFDDVIPFVDWFVIFYVLWYPLLIGVGLLLLIKDKKGYERYFLMIAIGFTASIIFFWILPNGQELRLAEFEKETIFTDLISMLWASDTNTNVLPSMHCYGSLCAMIAVIDSEKVKDWPTVVGVSLLSLLICASTCLIKQHSVLDAVAAVVMFVPLYIIVYWKRLFSRKASIYEKTNSLATASQDLVLESHEVVDIIEEN